jgi:xanthine dehydrogenase accessory factor
MNVLALATEAYAKGEKFCLAVIVGKSGSGPQVPGAKSLFFADGRIVGTIGGGCLEMECRRIALEALSTGKHLVREFKLDDDFGWDDGLICGGRVQVLLLPQCCGAKGDGDCIVYDLVSGSVRCGDHIDALKRGRPIREGNLFIEPVDVRHRLFVFGAGHVGARVAEYAARVGFRVSVIDDRAELTLDQGGVVADPESYAKSLETTEADFVCLVTRGHRNDSKALRNLVSKPNAYLGMIGSRRKREVVRKAMVEEGVCTIEQFDRVSSPMGVDIGAETVDEIALSIVAEMVKVRSALRGSVARCAPIS